MGALESHDQYFHLLQVISATLKTTDVKKRKISQPSYSKMPPKPHTCFIAPEGEEKDTHAFLLCIPLKRETIEIIIAHFSSFLCYDFLRLSWLPQQKYISVPKGLLLFALII